MANQMQTQGGGNNLLAVLQSEAVQKKLTTALPTHMTSDRFLRIATSAVTRTPKLLQCTQESVLSCLQDLSQLGLEPDGRRAHLIPYRDKCTLVIDYKGMVELVMRNGNVSTIHADVVCENDAFSYDKGEIAEHKIDFRNPRGDWYAVYAVVKFKDGTEKCEVMTQEEVYKIRNSSAAWGAWTKYQKKGPWNDHESEMAKKTVFKRLCKWVVMSPEIRDAIDIDDKHQHKAYDEAVDRLAKQTSISEQMAIAGAGMDKPTPEPELEPEAPHEPPTAPEGDLTYYKTQLAEAKTIADIDGIDQDCKSVLGFDCPADWHELVDDKKSSINDNQKQ